MKSTIQIALFVTAIFVVVAGMAAGCATSAPEAFPTRQGDYPGAKRIGKADKPPGTCEFKTQTGTILTLPCRDIVSDNGVAVGASDETKGAKRETKTVSECYMHLGDGTNRPVPCQYAGDAYLKLKDQTAPEAWK